MTTLINKNNNEDTNIVQLPEPSLIVLKYNSEEPGKVPTAEDLELGEVALGLCKGSEAIWVKNSENEILNLRTPNVDLFWGSFLLYYDTVEEFQGDLEAGLISNTSVVFIEETRQLWTNGVFFALSEKEVLDLINSRVYVFPVKTSELTGESTSDEISEVFGGPDAFKTLVENLKCTVSIGALRLNSDRAFAPVSISTCSKECEYVCKYSLILEWIHSGKYYTETITLNDDDKIFSVVRTESQSTFLEQEDNLGKILNENLELVKPEITCSWEFYNNGYEQISVYPSPDHDNPVVEKGYKVVFKGVYHWEHEEGKKDPVMISKDSTWKELTESGVESEKYTSVFLTEDTTFKVQLEAPKTGMMVRGEDVIFSDGKNDITVDTRTVRFGDRIYYGPSPKGDEKDFVEYDIRSLSETRIVLDGELHTITAKKISLDPDKYYVIGIPVSLGELSGIWQDGFPVMGAFHKLNNTIEVMNAAGIGINYNVYVTNNPGCFTDVTVEFK